MAKYNVIEVMSKNYHIYTQIKQEIQKKTNDSVSFQKMNTLVENGLTLEQILTIVQETKSLPIDGFDILIEICQTLPQAADKFSLIYERIKQGATLEQLHDPIKKLLVIKGKLNTMDDLVVYNVDIDKDDQKSLILGQYTDLFYMPEAKYIAYGGPIDAGTVIISSEDLTLSDVEKLLGITDQDANII